MTTQQTFGLALQHHQAERLSEAEALYRQILKAEPNHAGALHYLGIIAHQFGRHALAVELIRRSVAVHPHNPAVLANLGEAWRSIGRFDEAIAAQQRALQLKPDYAEAYHNLGNALSDRGQADESVAAYERALQLRPDYAEAHNSLGIALSKRHQIDQAIAHYRRALQFQPGFMEALNNLANALTQQCRIEEAIPIYHRVLQIQPDSPETHNNLGNALGLGKRFAEATAAYRTALQLKPNYPEAYNNLGNVATEQGRIEEAISALQRALELKPNYPDALNNLGNALSHRGQLDEAIAAFQQALQLEPRRAIIHYNLGISLAEKGRLDEAIAAFHRALAFLHYDPRAFTNLGNAYKDQGRVEEALAAYRRAIDLKAALPGMHSNLIYLLEFQHGVDERFIAAEQQHWNREFSHPVRPGARLHPHDRNPERRLRIGYVTPDFRDHVVGRNMLPLFRSHDRSRFEALCYSAGGRADEITKEFRQHASLWRDVASLSDESLAELIREDAVDILVDLTQHMAGNRLPSFARKPAPVQVSFAGYPAGTGLEEIPYRISDRYLEAEFGDGRSKIEGELRSPNFDLRAAERVLLIDSFWCYDPCGAEVEINDPPARESGGITFGSLNNFCKLNDPVLRLWARVLGKTRDSRLILLSYQGSHRQRTQEILRQEGIDPGRVEFVEHGSRVTYLRYYHRLDIALDPFPYNGHTTSLDALWMGVPVVSLAGSRSISRAGLSQLSKLGLEEWVAFSEEDYVEKAVRLAHDLPRLAHLRSTLRARMESSRLMDAPRFARSIEAVYRTLWRRWCEAAADAEA